MNLKEAIKENPDVVRGVGYVALALILVGGWHAYKANKAAKLETASDAFVSAFTTEEIEDAVAKTEGMAAQGAIKIRLAKSYFDAGRYEEAMALYDELTEKPVEGFAELPVVGKAQCLEALGRFDEAVKAFDAFAEANPKHYLTLTAQLGAARAIAQAGDKEKALARINALKAANKDEDLSLKRVEATEEVIKRFEIKK